MAFSQISKLRKSGLTSLGMIKLIFQCNSLSGLTGITIVSAYTDPVIIGELLDELQGMFDSRFRVRVLLDMGASGYHRDNIITDSLEKLAEQLREDFGKESGIFVVNLGRLMHSKVILLHFGKENRISLGSLNFTRRGFFVNEEIQAHLEREKDVEDVLEYVALIFRDKRCRQLPFSQHIKEDTVSSTREWLLRGRLFFEDKAANPYNFKLGLPKKLLKQPAFVIPGAEAEVSDNISILSLLKIPRAKQAGGWKTYCIATCYGYWCPAQLVKRTQEHIKEAVATKRESKVEKVLQNSRQLEKKFFATFNKIEKNIDQLNKKNRTRFRWDKDGALKRLKKWLPRVLVRLADPRNMERLLAGVDDSVVPDLWSGDEIALRDFEETFCAHIVIELSKSRVQNWVAQWLRDGQEHFEFGNGLALQERWEESWDDEDAWHEWLHCCISDPFAELPDQWELE